MRVGIGIDFHKFGVGRKLFIGGVEIKHDKGLIGHSDADVLLHAICDAMLGAAGLGDIGKYFPETEKYKGIRSTKILAEVNAMIKDRWQINNIDAVVIAEEPKLAHHIHAIRGKISKLLGISMDKVNVKATTTEGMGAIGRGEGIAAHSVVTLRDNQAQSPKNDEYPV
jgi:2-C-methyl-D-erythritol 2,4-cyclodiphosphate synthase